MLCLKRLVEVGLQEEMKAHLKEQKVDGANIRPNEKSESRVEVALDSSKLKCHKTGLARLNRC